MDKPTVLARFAFLAEAFDGSGGFAPCVTWEDQTITTKDQAGAPLYATRRVPKLAAPCHLVPYPRESAEKFASRAAVAVYENHLREACERFIGYLGRRRPVRDGIDAPLTALLVADADMRGTPLDQFFVSFALQAKARGSMLLMVDLPGQPGDESPASLQAQISSRKVPLLRMIEPEALADFEVDDDTGMMISVTIACTEMVGGKPKACTRTWDAEGWVLRCANKVIAQGPHPFGQCPFLALTESGALFPQVGKYAQIADLSRRLFNARSELDEILRSQTFSLLTLQIPPDAATYDLATSVAGIGTSSMLTHQGITPAFIAPDSGPASTYLAVIEQLQQSIKRIAMEEATAGEAAESGVARRLRFERLNSDLASFAHKLQSLEVRMWALFHRALGTNNRVTVEWPSDFNLVDTLAELDILAAMQATGFPPAVLAAKRETVVGAEFDAADDETKAALRAALSEQAQEKPDPTLQTGD